MTGSSTLATLAADPDRIADVRLDQVPELVGACAALQAALLLRLQGGAPQPAAAAATAPDRLLTAEEAAERLGVATRWMYRHAKKLPFTKRLTTGAVRFSERGLERWKESRPS